MDKKHATQDMILLAVFAAVSAALFTVGGIAIIYKAWRPEVTLWRKLDEAPDVEVPQTIKWKGATYECVIGGE